MTEDDEEINTGSGLKKRLTDSEFAAARELYELGKGGIADIAQDFGVARQTLSRKFQAAGVIKGSRAHELAGSTTAAAKAVVERYAERRAEWIEETRLEAVKSLKQARMIGQKIVGDAVKKSTAAGTGIVLQTVDDDLKALGRFNKILIDNFNASLAILKSDEHIDEEDLPVLTIDDLTDQDILNHHIATGALDRDATLEDINAEFGDLK
jgi:transposase-like protein